jgi:hypothetical protein
VASIYNIYASSVLTAAIDRFMGKHHDFRIRVRKRAVIEVNESSAGHSNNVMAFPYFTIPINSHIFSLKISMTFGEFQSANSPSAHFLGVT